jgi:hypothetical protein
MVADGVYINDVLTEDVTDWKYNNSITSVANYASVFIVDIDADKIDTIPHFADIKIYEDDVLEWRGIILDVIPANDSIIEVVCFGYMRILMGRFHTGVYTDEKRSDIVIDLVDKYGGGSITTLAGVTDTGDSITRTLKAKSVFDVIIELANEVNFETLLDDDLDLYFGVRGATSSGLSITLDEVVDAEAPTEGRNIYNKVFVYGDKEAIGGQPIALVEDRASQLKYNMVAEYPPITDPSLATNEECAARGQQLIDSFSEGVPVLKLTVVGYGSVRPGNTISVSGFLPRFNAPDGTYIVLEKGSCLTEGSQTLTLAQYTTATEDTIADLIRRMRKREYNDIDETAVALQILRFYEDVIIEGYTLTVKRIGIGSTMIAGHSTNGILGNTSNNIVLGYSGRTVTTDISETWT